MVPDTIDYLSEGAGQIATLYNIMSEFIKNVFPQTVLDI